MADQISRPVKIGDKDPIAEARGLAELLGANSARIEASGGLPPEILAAMHDAAIFRLLLPTSVGGLQLGFEPFADVMEILAGADASAAWCVGQAAGCSLAAAFLDHAVAAEVFGPRDAVLAWGPPSRSGRAVRVEGGYRLSGSWAFASGSRNAGWLGAHVPVQDDAGKPVVDEAGKPLEITALFPRACAKILDVWQVMGLRATGSDSYELSDHFVEERFTFRRDSADDRREDAAIYKLNVLGVYGIAFASVGLGIVRRMLDDFRSVAARKVRTTSRQLLKEAASAQLAMGRGEARWRAARAYLRQTVRELTVSLETDGRLSREDQFNLRVSVTHALQECRQISDTIFAEAGATSIFESEPFERRFRDMLAVAQQIQGHMANLETAGAVALGAEKAVLRL